MRRYIGQACCYAAFILAIGYFSAAPTIIQTPADQATLKISIRHAGKLVGDCRALTKEELQRLPPNMRQTEICPRERSPVRLEIDMDNEPLYRRVAPPSGLHRDGISTFYARFSVPSGWHQFDARLKDDGDHSPAIVASRRINIEPGRVMVVDFRDRFIFK